MGERVFILTAEKGLTDMKRVLIYFLAGIFVSGHGTATVHVDAERQRLELRQIATVNEPMFSVSTLPVCLDPNSNFVLVTKKRAGVIKAFDQARGRWIYEKWAKGDKPEFSTNQEFGGLLDVEFSNRDGYCGIAFVSYTEFSEMSGDFLAVDRIHLSIGDNGDVLEIAKRERLFTVTYMRPEGAIPDKTLFGGRMLQYVEGERSYLYLAVGDHSKFDNYDRDERSQDPKSPVGKLLRFENPETISNYEIVAYGLRDPQGITRSPDGAIWVSDHGPNGGDELNRFENDGVNFGWPVCSYGRSYENLEGPIGLTCRSVVSPEVLLPSKRQGSNFAPSGVLSGVPFLPSSVMIASLGGRGIGMYDYQKNRFSLSFDGKRVRDLAKGSDGRVYMITEARPGEPATALFEIVPIAGNR